MEFWTLVYSYSISHIIAAKSLNKTIQLLKPEFHWNLENSERNQILAPNAFQDNSWILFTPSYLVKNSFQELLDSLFSHSLMRAMDLVHKLLQHHRFRAFHSLHYEWCLRQVWSGKCTEENKIMMMYLKHTARMMVLTRMKYKMRSCH